MENKLKKKYGLLTAIAMVVGIVIGCGVFFKAGKVLTLTGGNLPLGILAWAIGGLIMIICAYVFSILAGRYERVNGFVDYADAALGPKYGYAVGWFLTAILYPSMAAPISWMAANYTCFLFNASDNTGAVLMLTAFYLVMACAINAFAPIVAGKIQVSATVIKLIPLLLMAIVGTIVGMSNGMTIYNMTTVVEEVDTAMGLFGAVVATAFAYEGWIIATSINAELKDAKKNLPRALIIGTFIVAAIYILYYIGLSGSATNQVLMENGENGVIMGFQNIFSNFFGSLLIVFVVISSLGTLNGIMLGATRSMYALAVRNTGPSPKLFSYVDKQTNTPINSSLICLVLCFVWLVYLYATQMIGSSIFGDFTFDMTELPIITTYSLYIPIFFMIIKKEKDLPFFKRYVAPILGILSCCFMVFAAIFSHGFSVVWYFVVFVLVMLLGVFYYVKAKKESPLE